MADFLVRHFIKDYEDVDKASVRTAYGMLASVVGIICNMVLFMAKFLIGIFLNSVSVTADAFNNLSDAASSVISFIGVKMAGKPADKEHPFGHGRIEYIAALIVSFLVIEVGITFLKESVGKITTPENLNFQVVSVVILLLSIGVKLWMGIFNRRLGKKIDSKVMMAVFTDSMGDVVTTGATIVSLVFFALTGVNIDGVVGLCVAVVVIWAGVGIARDTLEPLIGQAIDPQIYEEVERFVENYDGILGTHDLIIHNYGPNRSMASIHAEVPNDANMEMVHELIDKIERDAVEKLGIMLVIHMDPIETKDERVMKVHRQVEAILNQLDEQCSIHDFRMVSGTGQVNLIFDVVVPFRYGEGEKEDLRRRLMEQIEKIDERFQCIITVEHSYMQEDGMQEKS
ncbi:MAG: cation diffusion facilitator family transporter [Blautia sp.]